MKSDVEKEPESGDNREEERKGVGPECLSLAVAGPDGTLLAQEELRGNLCPKN